MTIATKNAKLDNSRL